MSFEERIKVDRNHESERIFYEALEHMDRVIAAALANLPAPKARRRGRVQFYRFDQNNLIVAFLLKMVQLTSNLRAGKLLIEHGFLYEWAMIRRLIQETIEDILFLAAADTKHKWTKNHDSYLGEFYAEDVNKRGAPSQRRLQVVPRHEIRSYTKDVVQEYEGVSTEMKSSVSELLRIMHRFDSGYIHGRASSIMRCYDPTTRQFLTNGLHPEHISEETTGFWISTWTVIMSFAMIGAKWFGQEYWQYSWELSERFGQAIGVEESYSQQGEIAH